MSGKKSRRTILKMFGYTVLGAGVTALSTSQYSFRIETRWLQLERVTIPVKNLGSSFEGFKIVLLSDFHLYPHTEIALIQRAVDMANDLKPDLVVLLGDYVLDEADSIFELAPVLARLNARHGVFSVLGNHDHWKGAPIVRRGLKESGLPVLNNSCLTLSRGQERIYLAGLAARGRSTFSELRWYPPMEAAEGSLSWVFRAKQPESFRTGP